jgi:hypothetical protein
MFTDNLASWTTNFVVQQFSRIRTWCQRIECTHLLRYERPTTFIFFVSHPTPSASTLGWGIRCSMCTSSWCAFLFQSTGRRPTALLSLTWVRCLAWDFWTSLWLQTRVWRGTPARHAFWQCVSLIRLPNWEVGGSVDRISCFIVLQMFAFKRFEHLEHLAFERSQITVPPGMRSSSMCVRRVSPEPNWWTTCTSFTFLPRGVAHPEVLAKSIWPLIEVRDHWSCIQ